MTPHEQEAVHARVAKATGWRLEDVRSFGIRMLREVVRSKDLVLADEIGRLIVSGRHVEITPVLSPRGRRRASSRA